MNMKKILEKRQILLDEMDTLVQTAENEIRALNETEEARFTEIKTEIEGLDRLIQADKERRSLLEDENDADDDDKGNNNQKEQEERAFEAYLRNVESRAGVNLTTTDNGAVIPASIANKIIEKVHEISPVYQWATRYNIKGQLNIPYYDESAGTVTMAYADEFVELESTAGKFSTISLNGFLAGTLSLISISLINNSAFDIVSYAINKMAESIANWIDKELLNGTTSKIDGMSGVTQSVTAAGATKVTADELIDLQECIPDAYQANSVWIMAKATRTAIRKLKDNDGNYILNKDATSRWGYTLFGKDVYVSENMSEMAADKISIFYGDPSGLAVKVSEDLNIQVLREKYATQHAVGVVGWMEIDSKVENAQKLAKLVQKSA